MHILGTSEKDAYEIFKGKAVWLPATEIWPANILKLFAECNAKNCHIGPKRQLSLVTKTSLSPVLGKKKKKSQDAFKWSTFTEVSKCSVCAGFQLQAVNFTMNQGFHRNS